MPMLLVCVQKRNLSFTLIMQVWKEFAKVIILTINFVTDINSQETVS